MGVPEQIKVLIVDDEADICFLFNNILRKRNLKAVNAKNLAEALASFEADPPSLVFMDNYLPDGQGIDFIPYIKQYYPFTKVVMITANDSLTDRFRAFQQGADAFLGKPLSLKLIHAELDRVNTRQ